MKTVKEVSRITGVSVRTLHHYDAIGLLKPTGVTDSGYRLYDDRALERLQTILFFRELEFSLQEIKEILDSPSFDPMDALQSQIRLLQLKRDHLDKLISHALKIQKTGVINLNFKPFDKTELDTYAAEAKAKWGSTDAYAECKKKNPGQQQADGLMALLGEFGVLKQLDPTCAEAQTMVARLQEYISRNYYNCTRQILAGLGQMYVADERFKTNIDQAGGEGTAQFISRAIAEFCK